MPMCNYFKGEKELFFCLRVEKGDPASAGWRGSITLGLRDPAISRFAAACVCVCVGVGVRGYETQQLTHSCDRRMPRSAIRS